MEKEERLILVHEKGEKEPGDVEQGAYTFSAKAMIVDLSRAADAPAFIYVLLLKPPLTSGKLTVIRTRPKFHEVIDS